MKSLKYNPKQRKSAWLFSFIVLAVISGTGAYMAFVVYPDKTKEHSWVSGLPSHDVASFSSLKVGEDALMSGVLSGNETLDNNDLVAFTVQIWEVEAEDRTFEGEWEDEKVDWPALQISVEGGQIRTTPGFPPSVTGFKHEVLKPSGAKPAAKYDDQELGNHSRRILGAKNGDQVVIVGKQLGAHTIEPEYFYFGSKAEFLDSFALSAKIILIFGLVLLATGVVFAAIILSKKDD